MQTTTSIIKDLREQMEYHFAQAVKLENAIKALTDDGAAPARPTSLLGNGNGHRNHQRPVRQYRWTPAIRQKLPAQGGHFTLWGMQCALHEMGFPGKTAVGRNGIRSALCKMVKYGEVEKYNNQPGEYRVIKTHNS